MEIVSILYNLARRTNDIKKVASGDPKKDCQAGKKQGDRQEDH